MRRLYLRIYLAVLVSLAAFAIVSGMLWRHVGEPAFRHRSEPSPRGANRRRLERRLSCGTGRWARGRGARHGLGRLDPHPGRLLRHRRLQAHVRARPHGRLLSARSQLRPRRAHHGAFAMFLVYSALILLPLVGLARGDLKSYHPLQLALPTMSIFYCFNIFTKLAVGALSGFEYVAILAGETRSPARDIGRSVLIASPIIALMFIFGTSSVLAFIGHHPIDLIGPVPQTLRLGLRSFPIAGAIASIGILLMTTRTIASTSVHVTGSSRLPMVAGWDQLLPSWFSRLHPRYKTPINSIIFVGTVTLVIAIASQIGAGIQEAFQLVDNAANVFYGIVYFTMFAIPIFGATEIRSGAPIWLRIAAICGAAVSLSAIYFTVHPIIDVPSTVTFAAKIIAVTAIANAIGVAIYAVGRKRQGT